MNINESALLFLETECANECNIALADKQAFTQTYSFFGKIAAQNRLGILYAGGENIDAFFDGLTAEYDDRFTIFISNLIGSFILHLNTIKPGAYEELQKSVIDAVTLTISSIAFPSELRERIDIGLLNDSFYFTLFMLQPALKNFIVRSALKLGVSNERPSQSVGSN